MSEDASEPIELASFGFEAQAILLVQALADRGIEAQAEGGATAGFRAEAPGDVKVLVKRADLERASAVLDDILDTVREHEEEREVKEEGDE